MIEKKSGSTEAGAIASTLLINPKVGSLESSAKLPLPQFIPSILSLNSIPFILKVLIFKSGLVELCVSNLSASQIISVGEKFILRGFWGVYLSLVSYQTATPSTKPVGTSTTLIFLRSPNSSFSNVYSFLVFTVTSSDIISSTNPTAPESNPLIYIPSLNFPNWVLTSAVIVIGSGENIFSNAFTIFDKSGKGPPKKSAAAFIESNHSLKSAAPINTTKAEILIPSSSVLPI